MNLIKSNQIIKEVITSNEIYEQRHLLKLLMKRGINITQSSLSRRLKKLGVSKVNGVYKVKQESSLKIEVIASSPNIVVIKTKPGHADYVATQIDNHNFDFILGCIAGDDTIFACINTKYDINSCANLISKFFNI